MVIPFVLIKNKLFHSPWSGADLQQNERQESEKNQYLFTALTAAMHVFKGCVILEGAAMDLLRLPVGLLLSLAEGSLTSEDETYVENISILSRPT